MDVRIYKANSVLLVQISGRIVLDVCDRLKTTVVPRIGKDVTQVSLDLAKVEFIDSAGLGLLVGLKVSSQKNRAKLALVAPSKNVNEILMVSKLDSIFDIVTGPEAETLRNTVAIAANLLDGDGDAGAGAGASATSKGPAFQSPPTGGGGSTTKAAPSPAASPKERIDQLCKNAIEFMRQGDYDRAAEAYRAVLEVDPSYLPAYNNLAIVYEKKPQWVDQAIEMWEKVLEMSSSHNDGKHMERAQKHLATLRKG